MGKPILPEGRWSGLQSSRKPQPRSHVHLQHSGCQVRLPPFCRRQRAQDEIDVCSGTSRAPSGFRIRIAGRTGVSTTPRVIFTPEHEAWALRHRLCLSTWQTLHHLDAVGSRRGICAEAISRSLRHLLGIELFRSFHRSDTISPTNAPTERMRFPASSDASPLIPYGTATPTRLPAIRGHVYVLFGWSCFIPAQAGIQATQPTKLSVIPTQAGIQRISTRPITPTCWWWRSPASPPMATTT